MAQKSRDEEAYEERHESPEAEGHRLRGSARDCIAFHFLDIFGYEDDVFNTRHFHLFFHYVLDLFLGLRRTLSYVMD